MDEVANDSSPFGMDIARIRPFAGSVTLGPRRFGVRRQSLS